MKKDFHFTNGAPVKEAQAVVPFWCPCNSLAGLLTCHSQVRGESGRRHVCWKAPIYQAFHWLALVLMDSLQVRDAHRTLPRRPVLLPPRLCVLALTRTLLFSSVSRARNTSTDHSARLFRSTTEVRPTLHPAPQLLACSLNVYMILTTHVWLRIDLYGFWSRLAPTRNRQYLRARYVYVGVVYAMNIISI